MTITKGLATVFLLIEMLAHSVTGYAFQGKKESVSVSSTRSHILAATWHMPWPCSSGLQTK